MDYAVRSLAEFLSVVQTTQAAKKQNHWQQIDLGIRIAWVQVHELLLPDDCDWSQLCGLYKRRVQECKSFLISVLLCLNFLVLATSGGCTISHL